MGTTEEIIREEDGELLGFVRPSADGRGWQPLTVFGYPMGVVASRDDAVEHITRRGLSDLAERWLVHVPEAGGWLSCMLVEAWRDSVLVRITDFGREDLLHTVRRVRSPSADNLRPAARGR